jgi:hypothetical protein
MEAEKDQHKVGVPEKPRGQEMGRPGFQNPNRQAMEDTPALSGTREDENEMFADESTQHVGANASAPKSNSPSVPAAIPTDVKLGESGGEAEFKERHSARKAKD